MKRLTRKQAQEQKESSARLHRIGEIAREYNRRGGKFNGFSVGLRFVRIYGYGR